MRFLETSGRFVCTSLGEQDGDREERPIFFADVLGFSAETASIFRSLDRFPCDFGRRMFLNFFPGII